MSELFRALPSMDAVLGALAALPEAPGDDPLADAPRPLVRELVNRFLDVCREEIRAGLVTDAATLHLDALLPRLACFVRAGCRPHFRRVLNATGVVIHTNLGRSILSEAATAAVIDANRRYSNLEFDLSTGKRGSRYSHVEEILCQVTGAEAGLVVNNNAAAVLLVLDTLVKGREVVVSRGQLVEIGGSFRIPEVMAKSGAILREVGATNRTHLHDYERAICEETGALLKVHTSNYRIVGFHKEVSLADLVALGRERGLPVLEDLGSGSFDPLPEFGSGQEPTVQQTVADGADVVTFSGDKVLGGPQAGIIVGRREYIEKIKKNPMNRALRIDKMTLAALEATLRAYLESERARVEVPTLAMITARPEELKRKADRLARVLRKELGGRLSIRTVPGASRVGGGSFPEYDLPTTLVRILPAGGSDISPDALRQVLLDTDPPLVGRIEDATFCLDPRTLAADEFRDVAGALRQALDRMS